MYPFEVKFANNKIVKVDADKPSMAISKAEEIVKEVAIACRNVSDFHMKLMKGAWYPAHINHG